MVHKRGMLVVVCLILSFICNIHADTASCIAACDAATTQVSNILLNI